MGNDDDAVASLAEKDWKELSPEMRQAIIRGARRSVWWAQAWDGLSNLRGIGTALLFIATTYLLLRDAAIEWIQNITAHGGEK